MKKPRKEVNINININVEEKNDITTQVAVIMDKSGSMGTVQKATIDGFNEYISTLKKKKGSYLVSLTYFDTEVEKYFTQVPINEVKKLTKEDYQTGGMTALYDGVGQTITALKRKVKDNTPVLVVIMTDGGENASREYDQRKIANLIKDQEKEGWTFVFIGANQDSWATAQTFGLTSVNNVVNFNATEKGVKSLFRGLGEGTTAYTASTIDLARSGAIGAQLNNSNFFSHELKTNIENSK